MTKKAGAASVREQFVRTIESQILSGERKIGDRLPSARELCKLLDVSLTTVNTGLGELAAKGFVEIVPRQGVFVADYLQRGTPDALISLIRYHGGRLGAAEVRNFCEARMAIDPDIAEWVIQRASDAQLDELGELLDDYRRSADYALFPPHVPALRQQLSGAHLPLHHPAPDPHVHDLHGQKRPGSRHAKRGGNLPPPPSPRRPRRQTMPHRRHAPPPRGRNRDRVKSG